MRKARGDSERLEMELWWCTADGVPVAHDSHDELRWLTADELGDVDWLDGDLAALPAVAERLRGAGFSPNVRHRDLASPPSDSIEADPRREAGE